MPSSMKATTLYISVPLPNTKLTANMVIVPTYRFKVRLWLGIQLLHLASWVLGCDFEFETGDRHAQWS